LAVADGDPLKIEKLQSFVRHVGPEHQFMENPSHLPTVMNLIASRGKGRPGLSAPAGGTAGGVNSGIGGVMDSISGGLDLVERLLPMFAFL